MLLSFAPFVLLIVLPIGKILSRTWHVTVFAFVVLMTFVFIGSGLRTLFAPPISPKDVAVMQVAGTLAADPEVQNVGRFTHIRLTLTEYPNRSFNIDDEAYDATQWKALSDNVFAADSVFMEVGADDYKNNIVGEQFPTSMLPVAVYSLRSRGQIFLTVAAYCKEFNSNVWVGYVLLIFGCCLLFGICFDGWAKWKHLRRSSE